ncbi:MAG: OmpA family protein, partial [Bacteroidota bacterium]
MKKIVLFILFFGNIMYLTGQESTDSYQIKFLEINKENSDYAVAMLDDDKLVFTSAANANTSNKRNHNPRKELFIGDIDFDGEILNVKPVTNKENNKFNTTGIAYTKDLKTVYFSRNKYVRKQSKQELAKNKRLELYKANVDGEGNWNNIEKLQLNDDSYSTGYPTLSVDNTKLYFVSDRLPSMGKTDIFVVDIKNDGTFGKPRNLGKKINTSGEETTPYITDKDILYFSSDGHQGKGNLDIFAIDVANNFSSDIHHLESPINSINDDFAYIINQETNRGFFTSNRLQGKNNNDLYSFTLKKEKTPEECFITVEGFVKDKESQELLKGTTVDLLDIKGALIQSVTTSDDGAYIFNVACSNEYKLSAINDDYKKEVKQIEILEQNYHRSLQTNMNLTKLIKDIVEDKTKEDNVKITSINAIHFDFDKAILRNRDLPELDKIVKIMKDNTNIKVEAIAYTDSRGSHAYNKLLSQRRAKATVEYIISKGIEASRIIGKGYGEEKLVNQCIDGVECSEEAHEKNRRTEFVILNNVSVNDQNKNNEQVINTKISDKVDNKNKQVENKIINKEKALTVSNTKKPIENNLNTDNTIYNKSEDINQDLAISSPKQEISKNDLAVNNQEVKENNDNIDRTVYSKSEDINQDL